eukprot:scaffold303381_cov30-Tisochrysis_lutea.AAC.2
MTTPKSTLAHFPSLQAHAGCIVFLTDQRLIGLKQIAPFECSRSSRAPMIPQSSRLSAPLFHRTDIPPTGSMAGPSPRPAKPGDASSHPCLAPLSPWPVSRANSSSPHRLQHPRYHGR